MIVYFTDGKTLAITTCGCVEIKDRIMIVYDGTMENPNRRPIAHINMNIVKYVEYQPKFIIAG